MRYLIILLLSFSSCAYLGEDPKCPQRWDVETIGLSSAATVYQSALELKTFACKEEVNLQVSQQDLIDDFILELNFFDFYAEKDSGEYFQLKLVDELGEDSVGACVIGLQTRPIRSFYVKIGDIQQIFPTNADAAQFYVKRDSSRIELKAFAENGIDSLVYSAEYNEANLNVYLQIGSHTIDLNETMFVKVMDIVITDNNSRVESDYFGCISLKPEY